MTRKPSAGDGPVLEWIKSSYSSNEDGAACVEVAPTPGAVIVRDSKDIPRPSLGFTATAWADFVSYASEG
jgi:hypothetical protein